MNSQPTFLFLTYLNLMNDDHIINSLNLSFMNIKGLRSNFVDCESSLESNSV